MATCHSTGASPGVLLSEAISTTIEAQRPGGVPEPTDSAGRLMFAALAGQWLLLLAFIAKAGAA